jgi:hypothetical protein
MAYATEKGEKLTPAQRRKASKVQREIARRNAAFKKASPAQKRVLIAKDVIAQVKAKRFIAQSGIWAAICDKDGKFVSHNNVLKPADAQVQSLFLSGDVAKCNCCALGGILMSCTLYNNHQSLKDLNQDLDISCKVKNGEKFSNGLHRFFSRRQLALIECAFEGGSGGFIVYKKFDADGNIHIFSASLLRNVPRVTLERVLDYWKDYPKPDRRMYAIMQNIIKNKGTFKP